MGALGSSPETHWNAPLHAVIVARPRSLEFLGANLPSAFNGEFAANLELTGTARRPEIQGSLSATGLGTLRPTPSGKLGLTFDYSSEREQYSFAAHYLEPSRGRLDFTGGGHWGWLEHGLGRDWSAQAEGRIERSILAQSAISWACHCLAKLRVRSRSRRRRERSKLMAN